LARLRNRTGPSLPQQPTPPASPLPLASAHGHSHAHIADRGAGGRCTSYCQDSSNHHPSEAAKGTAASAGSAKGPAADGSHINGLAHHVSTHPLSASHRYAVQKLAPFGMHTLLNTHPPSGIGQVTTLKRSLLLLKYLYLTPDTANPLIVHRKLEQTEIAEFALLNVRGENK